MRSLLAGALALLAGGCLKANATQCDNGAICPDGYSCTEQSSLCGPTLRVETCMGKAEFASCDYRDVPSDPGSAGTCHAGICTQCTEEFAGCKYPGWTAMRPSTDDLLGLWVASDIDVDVVGSNGTLLHYDGYAWKRDDAFGAAVGLAEVTGIWRDANSGGFIVTANGDIFTKTPTGWMKTAATSKVLRSIYAASSTDAVAVGLAGAIIEFDGTTSAPATSPIPSYPYRAVWVAADGQAWAVGTQGGIVRRVNGTWMVARAPSGSEPALRAVWGRNPNDVWIVGDPPASGATQLSVFHYDGNTLSPVTLPNTIAVPLSSLWGNATELWAAADDASITHFDGTTWLQIPTDAGVPLRGVAAGEQDVFAVGGAGRILRFTGP
jgi:hypothetical protein